MPTHLSSTSITAPTGMQIKRAVSASEEPWPNKAMAVSVPDSERPVSPLLLLHHCLRGRYVIVIVFVLAIGALGGLVGWRFSQPLYRSEGLIQIKYVQPPVDPNHPDNGSTPFDVFIQSQQTLITSRRVVERALHDPAWLALNRPVTPGVLRGLASNLVVEAKTRAEYLKITYTDSDPTTAAAIVQAVTNAYVEVYNSDEEQIRDVRLKVWHANREEVAGRLKDEQAAIDRAVQEFGSADLAPLHDAAFKRVAQLESALQELQIAMASAPARRPPATSRPSESQVSAAPLTPEEIAISNPVMASYIQEERRLEGELEALKLRGYGESHQDVRLLRASLARAAEQIEQYAAEYNSMQQILGRAPGGPRSEAPGVLATRSPGQLRDEEATLRSLKKDAQNQMVRLETARMEVERRQSGFRRDADQIDHIDRMIDSMQDQDQMGGRLTVINSGEAPLAPVTDNRMKLAAMGGFGGACFPVALFASLGLVRRRYRYADETAAGVAAKVPLLAILPTLREADSDTQNGSEKAYGAAQRVHQVRVMLQVSRSDKASSCYLLSSASPGEGKTSLTMALGLSFAASGSRTLVIDADLVGRQLTTKLDGRELPGLHEALRSGTLRRCVRKTSLGLYVLPVGQADAKEACTLSSSRFRDLLLEARRHFETILIDSGPILGSVESTLAAQHADGVMLIVARGQQPVLVDRALVQLKTLGASVSGVVFNRAETKDFFKSCDGSSTRSMPSGEIDAQPIHKKPGRFGPLVDAVVRSLPAAMATTPL